MLLLAVSWPVSARAQTTAPSTAVVIALHGEVDDYTRDSLFRKFAEARKLGATTVILDLDTPGGLVVAALDISQFLRRQNDLHVIAYVSSKAYSAGSMIAVACNEIVMAPSAVIGDCAPIVFDTSGQLQPLPAAERAKQQSPIVSDFDASAARNGYDPQLLEAMVIVERVIHVVEKPPLPMRFVDDTEYAQLIKQGWKPVAGLPDPLDTADSLLTLQTDQALKVGLAKSVADSAQALAEQRGLKIIADLSPGTGEQMIELLDSAAVRGVLMTIFMVCLYIALGSPGHGAAEAIAIVALGLLVGVPMLTGYAQWWELAAIFIGLALLAFEVFVFPGHGVSAIAGIILILAGFLMTFVGKEPAGFPGWLPSLDQTWSGVRQGVIVITSALLASLLLTSWLRRYLPHLPYFNRLILNATSGGPAASVLESAPGNAWPGVGTAGTAVTDLRPGGSAEFDDLSLGDRRTIAVVSESGYLSAGAKVVVRQSRGNFVVVARAIRV
jgi:membrane-bound serine protease (ClpP class)